MTTPSSNAENKKGGDFYNGIEHFACWLLDNVEGETMTEELLRGWAVEAWKEHLKRNKKALEEKGAGITATREGQKELI